MDSDWEKKAKLYPADREGQVGVLQAHINTLDIIFGAEYGEIVRTKRLDTFVLNKAHARTIFGVMAGDDGDFMLADMYRDLLERRLKAL